MTWRSFPASCLQGNEVCPGRLKVQRTGSSGDGWEVTGSDIPARIAHGMRLSWRVAPTARWSPPVGRGPGGDDTPVVLLNHSSHSHQGEKPPAPQNDGNSSSAWLRGGHIPSKSSMEAAAGGQQRTGLRQHAEPSAHTFILALPPHSKALKEALWKLRSLTPSPVRGAL